MADFVGLALISRDLAGTLNSTSGSCIQVNIAIKIRTRSKANPTVNSCYAYIYVFTDYENNSFLKNNDDRYKICIA